MVVKEQRVDGSYIKQKSRVLVLRCTRFVLFVVLVPANLKHFERNNQVKILSNRNIQYREFSTSNNNIGNPCLLSESPKEKINPWFITGFSDAESSFSVTIRRNSRHNT